MSTFVIRNQGFFYTDEYFAPVGEYKQIVKRTFATREAAEDARRAYVRGWIRQHPLGDFLFDDADAIEKVVAVLRARWAEDLGELTGDELYELTIPKGASDADVDAILEAAGLELAKVFEVGADEEVAEQEVQRDELESDEEEADFEEDDDEIYWGPREGQRPLRVIVD